MTTPAIESEEPSPEHDAVDQAVSFGVQSRDMLPLIIVAAGVVAGLSGQHPTGNVAADFVLSFAFGAGVVWFAGYAKAQAVLLSAVLALFFSGLQLPAALFAGVALVIAVLITSWRRFDRDSWLIGAAVSALFTSKAVLHLPDIGFSTSASFLAAGAVAPLVVTGFVQLGADSRRRVLRGLAGVVVFAVVASILAAVAALSVRDRVETGIDQAEDGVTALEAGDQPEAVAQLTDAQTNFESASDRLSGPLTWPARLVPISAQHARALETASDQGAALARTAVRTVTRADVEEIRGQNGQIDLELVQDVNTELRSANLALRDAQESLRDVDTPWLLPQLSSRLASVQEELQATAEDIDLANHATSVLPNIMGAQGPRRYLVLFAQPAESREFGGFVGAYGMLEADQGRLDLTESGSIDTDIGLGTAEFTNAGAFPEDYFRISPNINGQNLTAIADLTTIAAAARDFVPQWREDPDYTIDGVITMDPYALAGLLELTGPIFIEGRAEPLDATNVVDFLLRGQYTEFDQEDRDERQDLLKVLAAEAFDQLLRIEIPGPERLGAVFGPIARANRIGFSTFNNEENVFLDRVFLSADLPRVDESTDMLGVYTATGTASKLDAYGRRDITYVVDVDPATGSVQGHAEVLLTNDAPVDASSYVLGVGDLPAESGGVIDSGTNVLALSVYNHQAITNMASDDATFAVFEPRPALGYERSWMRVEVPQGEQVTMRFETSATVVPGRYDLVVPPSQAANPGDFTLVVRPAPGWRVVADDAAVDGTWTRTISTDSGTGFSLSFARDQ